MLGIVDATAALADLTDISPQIRKVVVIEADGSVAGSNLPDSGAAERLAESGLRLAAEADAVRGGAQVAQLEAATASGSVFVVRDGGRAIVATTRPEPTVGLVFYDLKTTLSSISTEEGDSDGAA
jgi:predicted regulator of Ras-like GTPase activity (Roadblock/LC7/MglB family)